MTGEFEDRVYDIYGHTYTFTNVHMEAGVLRGWYARRKKWAWLFDTYIQIDGDMPVPAVAKHGEKSGQMAKKSGQNS